MSEWMTRQEAEAKRAKQEAETGGATIALPFLAEGWDWVPNPDGGFGRIAQHLNHGIATPDPGDVMYDSPYTAWAAYVCPCGARCRANYDKFLASNYIRSPDAQA